MKIINPNLEYVGGFSAKTNYSHIISVTPEQFEGGDTSRINQAIDFAYNNNISEVVCNGNYFLDSAILLKSNITFINNGVITMNSGMRDNMLRAASSTVGNPINNIKIKGNGIFQGSGDNWGGDNPSDVGTERWRSIGILLPNCTNFELEGFTVKNSHCWGICLEQSRFGSIKNIHFDQNGEIPNQDGVNVRRGSHNIIIENISGITADDLIAVTNLILGPTINYLGNTIYETGKTNFDMYQIVIRNINGVVPPKVKFGFVTAVNLYSGGITLLCEDGLKIHDVSIDGVNGYSQINLGIDFLQYWVTTQATVDDMYNISISNTGIVPVYTNRPIKNSSIINCAPRDFEDEFDCAAFKTGSLNVVRKYNNEIFEYFQNVTNTGGDFHLVTKQDLFKYKVYTATADDQTGTGTDDPSINILGDNTIGNIVWTRITTGLFFGTLVGAFPAGKTHLSITPSSPSGSYSIFRNTDDVIVIKTQDNGTMPFTDADGKLFNNSFKIEVYP